MVKPWGGNWERPRFDFVFFIFLTHECDFWERVSLKKSGAEVSTDRAIIFFFALLDSFFTWLKDTKSLVFLLLSCVKWKGAAGLKMASTVSYILIIFLWRVLNALGVLIDVLIFLLLYLIFGMWLYTGVIYEYDLVGRP